MKVQAELPMNDIAFLPAPVRRPGANIKVVGVGGAGCNALSRMIENDVTGVQFIAMNTDQQSLSQCLAEIKISLGPVSMRGLGAGGDPERGQNAAEESREEILASLSGADMVFITAGMGGGTGTGAAPVVAGYVREITALAVAVVTTPFEYEGRGTLEKARGGLGKLRDVADSVIVVSNGKLSDYCPRDANTQETYEAADSVLIQGVRGITDLILRPGVVNGDFADVKSVLCDSREALIGTGEGSGREPVKEGVIKALECPLLERRHQGSAKKVIVSVMGDWKRLPHSAVKDAMNYLTNYYKGRPDIKLCQAQVPELKDRVLVTVLASGFEEASPDYGQGQAAWHAQSADPAPQATPAEPTTLLHSDAPSAQATEVGRPGRRQTQPTPSGEVHGMTQAQLEYPTILRQGKLFQTE
jgi:cell division protein FtsZ